MGEEHTPSPTASDGQPERVGLLRFSQETPRRLVLLDRPDGCTLGLCWVGLPGCLAAAAWLCAGEARLEHYAGAVFLATVAGLLLWTMTRSARVELTRVGASRVKRRLGFPFRSAQRFGIHCPRTAVNQTWYEHSGRRGRRVDYPVYVPVVVGLEGELALAEGYVDRAKAAAVCRRVDAFLRPLFAPPEERQQRVAAAAPWARSLSEPPRAGLCPYCREELDEGLVACEGCRTPYHAECAVELGRCGTAGCAHGGARRRA